MTIPKVGLFIYPNINPFHFSIPHIIFKLDIEEKQLFDLKIFSLDGEPVQIDQSMIILPNGGLELMAEFDIVIIPGWDELDHRPDQSLIDALNKAYKQGRQIVGLCYGTYALAYSR